MRLNLKKKLVGPFSDADLQRKCNELEAMAASPAYIASEKDRSRKDRAEYWKSWGFGITATMTIASVAMGYATHRFGLPMEPLQWGLLVGVPAMTFAMTFPR